MSAARKFVLLGATGSIGENTLRVLRKHPDKLELVGISAKSQADKLASIAREFSVPHACLQSAPPEGFSFPGGTSLLEGDSGIESLAALPDADFVVVAVVGAAGLRPTLAALEAGKDVVLANKEALVVGGEIVTRTAEENGARIIPADSEHNAVFQCLMGQPEDSLDSIILTASGGPFRDTPAEELAKVTPEEALRHPNWSMGKKITIDSATMANKGLELIEARWLFNLPSEKLEVVIHPPSLVHAFVRLIDGCCLAQLTPPSMTFALQNAMLYPERAPGVDPSIDFSSPLDLSFFPPDYSRFPCLRLAKEALSHGGNAPLVFNAANEVAVDAFLMNRIGFLQISDIIDDSLNTIVNQSADSLEALLELDLEVRRHASTRIDQLV
ncbi:MAG TPA: 1-deoxy-D-xylulose-5-phosphate reductoisomerase [Opitutae bacterium]|nr:1-deoxy-D-xylulose-5-phosphate reductoisomerase [Opitutae bacterium]